MSAQLDLHVSVHDVMPGNLDRIENLVDRIEACGLGPAILLIVPGLEWDEGGLDRLRELAGRGHALAGHGWVHRVRSIKGIRHRLHSLLVSRDVAEHLALDADGIRKLIARCFAWFDQNDLPTPTSYVPPAWAMGPIRRNQLAGLGFTRFESLSGTYDVVSGRFEMTPLIGFEADTRLRATSLRFFNALNHLAANRVGALRVAIHPNDLALRLAADLGGFLSSVASRELVRIR